jgi:hypothetical protein
MFGEMGVIIPKDDIQETLKNRGLTCMFVGSSVDHECLLDSEFEYQQDNSNKRFLAGKILLGLA